MKTCLEDGGGKEIKNHHVYHYFIFEKMLDRNVLENI